MSKSNTFENDLLKLIFNGGAIANLADNASSAPLTNLYASLHTADPGEGGSQSTNEISYTGYARVAIARTAGGFTVSGSSATLTSPVDFPEMTGGAGGTVTHFAIGTDASGAGKILYSGTTDPDHVIQVGNIPRLKTGTTITED